MTSLLRSTREVSANTGYYIPIGDCRSRLFAYNPVDGQSTFSTATWAAAPTAAIGLGFSTLVASAGVGLLRDMGKTVTSSLRVFRKVQLVVNNSTTYGVGGQQPTTWPSQDFLTAYIELGFEGGGLPTPVAAFGR